LVLRWRSGRSKLTRDRLQERAMNDIERLAPNFTRGEFACRCGCGANYIRQETVDVLQKIRDIIGKPIQVTSGVRCERHNRRVNGARRSKHLTGEAADIRVIGKSPREVALVANQVLGPRGGVKAYATFCHVDIRSGYWRA
jgi:uncharacterized protein YcbK (DUF882 family)